MFAQARIPAARGPATGHGSPAPPTGVVVSRIGGRHVSRAETARLIADPAVPYVDTITVSETEHLAPAPWRDNGCGNHRQRCPDLRKRYGPRWIPMLRARIGI
jgi:hypothetical protein